MEEIVRGKVESTFRVRLRAWLPLRAAIRDRTNGRDEPVVALRPLVEPRHPDVVRRVGLEPRSAGLAVAERFLERKGYVKPVAVGTEFGAFVVTDVAGAGPLGQSLVEERV